MARFEYTVHWRATAGNRWTSSTASTMRAAVHEAMALLREGARESEVSEWKDGRAETIWKNGDFIRANPTPRIKKSRLSSQPSQLTRDDPSPRLVKRRKATNKQAMPGVWANPLTRVKVTSESQRGAPFTPRLKARRQTTKKAPPGFYANPAPSNARPYLGVEMLEREGLEYGLDAVTPVSWTFTTKKGGTARASYSYSLPADLVKSREFQTWARAAGGRVIMSLKSLKATLKAMQS